MPRFQRIVARCTVALLIVCICCACLAGPPQSGVIHHTKFEPGQVWLDVDGKPIQSHLGGVLYDNGRYYWYGMNFAGGKTLAPFTLPNQRYSWMANQGVTIYSSTDLYNWKLEAVELVHSALVPADALLIRPKVIKNDRTGKYVMMASRTAPDFRREHDILVATSDSPKGPFTASHILLPGGGCDITLYKDDDGQGYLITTGGRVTIHRLTDDYLYIRSSTTVITDRVEAPAVFKTHGTYYLLVSGLTGWAPNANHYYVASSLTGPWTAKGTFATGPGAKNTFASQTTFVLPVADMDDCFIFMADRTMAKSATVVPDLNAMTHVWLPIVLDPNAKSIEVPWRAQWDLSVFHGDAAKNDP